MYLLFCNCRIPDDATHNIIDTDQEHSALYFTSRPTSFYKRIYRNSSVDHFDQGPDRVTSASEKSAKKIFDNFPKYKEPKDSRIESKGSFSLFFCMEGHEIEFAQVDYFYMKSFDSSCEEYKKFLKKLGPFNYHKNSGYILTLLEEDEDFELTPNIIYEQFRSHSSFIKTDKEHCIPSLENPIGSGDGYLSVAIKMLLIHRFSKRLKDDHIFLWRTFRVFSNLYYPILAKRKAGEKAGKVSRFINNIFSYMEKSRIYQNLDQAFSLSSIPLYLNFILFGKDFALEAFQTMLYQLNKYKHRKKTDSRALNFLAPLKIIHEQEDFNLPISEVTSGHDRKNEFNKTIKSIMSSLNDSVKERINLRLGLFALTVSIISIIVAILVK